MYICMYVVVRWLIIAGRGPAYSDPSAETFCRSNALAQDKRGIGCVCECLRVKEG